MSFIHNTILRIWASLGFWGSVELFGSLLVSVGCIGELCLVLREKHSPSHRREGWMTKSLRVISKLCSPFIRFAVRRSLRFKIFNPERKHSFEKVFVFMVAIGVTMELIALFFSLREVAELHEKTAELRKENLELGEKLNPLNQPIASISAIVTFEIRGTNFDKVESFPNSLRTFNIVGKGGNLVSLRCFELSSKEEHISARGTKFDGKSFSMAFEWMGEDSLVMPGTVMATNFQNWVARSSATPRTLDKEMTGATVGFPGLQKGFEIVAESCVVTLNRSVAWRFSSPKEMDNGWLIWIEPIRATSPPKVRP